MKVKIEKLAELSNEELIRQGDDLQEQLFRMRFQLQTGNVENPSRLPMARQSLARVKTLLRERALGVERHRRTSREASPQAAGKGRGE